MKNINLIETIVLASLQNVETCVLAGRIVTLIQAHPEDVRENVLALLTGTAELTVRPIEQVKVVAKDDGYSDLFLTGTPQPDFLKGTIQCSVSFIRTRKRWYKNEEDAQKEQNGYSYQTGEYIIEKTTSKKDTGYVSTTLEEWNTGVVTYR